MRLIYVLAFIRFTATAVCLVEVFRVSPATGVAFGLVLLLAEATAYREVHLRDRVDRIERAAREQSDAIASVDLRLRRHIGPVLTVKADLFKSSQN